MKRMTKNASRHDFEYTFRSEKTNGARGRSDPKRQMVGELYLYTLTSKSSKKTYSVLTVEPVPNTSEVNWSVQKARSAYANQLVSILVAATPSWFHALEGMTGGPQWRLESSNLQLAPRFSTSSGSASGGSASSGSGSASASASASASGGSASSGSGSGSSSSGSDSGGSGSGSSSSGRGRGQGAGDKEDCFNKDQTEIEANAQAFKAQQAQAAEEQKKATEGSGGSFNEKNNKRKKQGEAEEQK